MRSLYIYPWESWPEQRERARRAKEELGLDEMIQPTPAGPGTPGISGRVLAFGSMPPFACDYALVRSDAGMKDALSWACGLTEDRRAATIATWLTNVMGGKVEEL